MQLKLMYVKQDFLHNITLKIDYCNRLNDMEIQLFAVEHDFTKRLVKKKKMYPLTMKKYI